MWSLFVLFCDKGPTGDFFESKNKQIADIPNIADRSLLSRLIADIPNIADRSLLSKLIIQRLMKAFATLFLHLTNLNVTVLQKPFTLNYVALQSTFVNLEN